MTRLPKDFRLEFQMPFEAPHSWTINLSVSLARAHDKKSGHTREGQELVSSGRPTVCVCVQSKDDFGRRLRDRDFIELGLNCGGGRKMRHTQVTGVDERYPVGSAFPVRWLVLLPTSFY